MILDRLGEVVYQKNIRMQRGPNSVVDLSCI